MQKINIDTQQKALIATDVTTEEIPDKGKDLQTITFESSKAEFDAIKKNFIDSTVIKIIPLLSNGKPSKTRYIYFPLITEYVQPNSMRGGIFRALKYAYTNPPYIDFQPKMVTLDEDESESVAFAQYYATFLGYENFVWLEVANRKTDLEKIYQACVSELSFISGETSNGILTTRFEELKKEFEEKIKKFAEPWYYKESDWTARLT